VQYDSGFDSSPYESTLLLSETSILALGPQHPIIEWITRTRFPHIREFETCTWLIDYSSHLVPSLRISGTISPFTHMTSLCTEGQVNICVTKTNPMQNLSSVYFVSQYLHVSDIFVAHHQEVYCIYTTIGTYCAFQLTVWQTTFRQTTVRQSIEKHNTYQLLYIYSIPLDDGLQICPKHVDIDWQNKLRIGVASGWFLLHRCIEMHGQQKTQ
jgi:hypothetical protein